MGRHAKGGKTGGSGGHRKKKLVGKAASRKQKKNQKEQERQEWLRTEGKNKKQPTKPATDKSASPAPLLKPALVPPAPKRHKPGFDSLLNALGVVESEDEDDDDEDAADSGDGEGLEEGAESGDDAGDQDRANDLPLDDGDDNAAAAEPQSESSDEEAAGDDASAAVKGASVPEEDRVDFFHCFWDDPPPPIPGPGRTHKTQDKASLQAGADHSKPQRFEVPGLSRCEAHRRNVTGLLECCAAPASVAMLWAQCALAPGLQEGFEQWLASEKIEISPQEGALFIFLHAYLDVAFPQQTHENARAIRSIYMLHVVNHIVKATAAMFNNVADAKKKAEDGGGWKHQLNSVTPDMGFCRARVLILCPFKSVAYDLVHMIMRFCKGKGSNKRKIFNKNRFEEEYKAGPDMTVDESKPADWKHLFGGNNEDCFRIGLTFGKKTLRLYTPFSASDVLICSPLGLRQITGAAGDSKRDYDFLSSIEVCIVDRADVLHMQNWEHVQEVLSMVNTRPKDAMGIDISRLRPEFADGRARAFRQTCVTSAGQCMDVDAVFHMAPTAVRTSRRPKKALTKAKGGGKKRKGGDDDDFSEEEMPMDLLPGEDEGQIKIHHNCRGLVRLTDESVGDPLRRCSSLGISRQFFLHVPCESLQGRNDKLMAAFEEKYWKPLGSTLSHLLIVANSYLSFLQLRKRLKEMGASYCAACEYTKKLGRARIDFASGDRAVLLVTERLLWYRRYRLKGADYVLFFGPPETAAIYEEILSNVRVPSQCQSMCLFTRHDGFAVERIAGHERALRMLTSQTDKVFVFS